MHVVYINTFYAPDEVGGAEKSVRFLAESVVSHGHQATVICLGRTVESRELNGVRIERLSPANSYFPLDANKQTGLQKLRWHTRDSYNTHAGTQVAQLIDKLKPDVVHTNNLGGFSVSVWSAIRERGIRIVHTLRDYYLLCPNTAMFHHGKQCTNRCVKCAVLSVPRTRATRHVDMVVGNSQFILDKHLQYGLFEGSQRQVIYNAYEPEAVRHDPPQDHVHLGYIGRIAPTKGVDILIAAVKRLVGQGITGFKVSVAGDGDPEYIKKLNLDSDGLPIVFVGRVKPEDFYSQLHWTVVPSVWDEPLARVIFESFSHGVPVIGSATGGTPELLHGNQTGLLYQNASDPSSLAEAMRHAINTPNETNLQKSCLQESERFKPRRVYESYKTTYLGCGASSS